MAVSTRLQVALAEQHDGSGECRCGSGSYSASRVKPGNGCIGHCGPAITFLGVVGAAVTAARRLDWTRGLQAVEEEILPGVSSFLASFFFSRCVLG